MGSEQPQDPFPISPCTIDDIDSLYAVYLAAFSLFEVHDLLYPPSTYDHEDSAVWFRKRVIQQLSQPEIHWFKITDASTGQVVAIARWGYPHVRPPKKEEEKTEELKKLAEASAWPKGTNVKLANAKFGRLGVWREKYIDWENTYSMSLLTSPISFCIPDPTIKRKAKPVQELCHSLNGSKRASPSSCPS